MTAEFSNVYDDETRADAYAKLEFPGTYYLAYRDLPAIIAEHVQGRNAIDFGCGTGRSTRFLRELGFHAAGVDIAEHMLARARERDPEGEYHLVPDGDLSAFPAHTYDLVLSALTFDNVPTMQRKVALFQSLKQLLKGNGRIVSLVSSPEIYVNEWASFSTKDSRPVEDILCTDEDYHDVYKQAELVPIKTYRPLAKPTEPYSWVSETMISPWAIYVLGLGE